MADEKRKAQRGDIRFNNEKSQWEVRTKGDVRPGDMWEFLGYATEYEVDQLRLEDGVWQWLTPYDFDDPDTLYFWEAVAKTDRILARALEDGGFIGTNYLDDPRGELISPDGTRVKIPEFDASLEEIDLDKAERQMDGEQFGFPAGTEVIFNPNTGNVQPLAPTGPMSLDDQIAAYVAAGNEAEAERVRDIQVALERRGQQPRQQAEFIGGAEFGIPGVYFVAQPDGTWSGPFNVPQAPEERLPAGFEAGPEGTMFVRQPDGSLRQVTLPPEQQRPQKLEALMAEAIDGGNWEQAVRVRNFANQPDSLALFNLTLEFAGNEDKLKALYDFIRTGQTFLSQVNPFAADPDDTAGQRMIDEAVGALAETDPALAEKVVTEVDPGPTGETAADRRRRIFGGGEVTPEEFRAEEERRQETGRTTPSGPIPEAPKTPAETFREAEERRQESGRTTAAEPFVPPVAEAAPPQAVEPFAPSGPTVNVPAPPEGAQLAEITVNGVKYQVEATRVFEIVDRLRSEGHAVTFQPAPTAPPITAAPAAPAAVGQPPPAAAPSTGTEPPTGEPFTPPAPTAPAAETPAAVTAEEPFTPPATVVRDGRTVVIATGMVRIWIDGRPLDLPPSQVDATVAAMQEQGNAITFTAPPTREESAAAFREAERRRQETGRTTPTAVRTGVSVEDSLDRVTGQPTGRTSVREGAPLGAGGLVDPSAPFTTQGASAFRAAEERRQALGRITPGTAKPFTPLGEGGPTRASKDSLFNPLSFQEFQTSARQLAQVRKNRDPRIRRTGTRTPFGAALFTPARR